ncbi:hypothetical protein FRC11_002795, partial [Ceratobasidium sp. 423]
MSSGIPGSVNGELPLGPENPHVHRERGSSPVGSIMSTSDAGEHAELEGMLAAEVDRFTETVRILHQEAGRAFARVAERIEELKERYGPFTKNWDSIRDAKNAKITRKVLSRHAAEMAEHEARALAIRQDKLCSFALSLLATRDNVAICLAPEGAAAVYFPPQISASRKGKEKDEDNFGASLEPLPPDEFSSTPLETLVETYGTNLRITETLDTCFECTTGSHIR